MEYHFVYNGRGSSFLVQDEVPGVPPPQSVDVACGQWRAAVAEDGQSFENPNDPCAPKYGAQLQEI